MTFRAHDRPNKDYEAQKYSKNEVFPIPENRRDNAIWFNYSNTGFTSYNSKSLV